MASGPMRQSIPLADTIRALAGDATGLANELKKERIKLEREIQKTLESAGQVDGKLTQKLDELRKRELSAKIYSDREAERAGIRRDSMAVRQIGARLSGTAELAAGRFSVRNIEDVGELLGMAGNRLAKSGYIGAGNKLARIAEMVSAGVSSIGLPVMAAVATATAGYDLGGKLGDMIWGNAKEMESEEKRKASYQKAVWQNRKNFGDDRTAFMLSQQDNPWAALWLMRDTTRNGQQMYDQANRERADYVGYWGRAGRPFGKLFGKDYEKEDAAWIAERMTELEKAEKEKLEAYRRDPRTIQNRAIAAERLRAIKAAEDERFERKQSWASW